MPFGSNFFLEERSPTKSVKKVRKVQAKSDFVSTRTCLEIEEKTCFFAKKHK